MEHGTQIQPPSKKAAERLRKLKETWGATWAQMGAVLDVAPSSLAVYASAENWRDMPSHVVERINLLPDLSPILDKGNSGSLCVVLYESKWRTMSVPDLRPCLYCGSLFIPAHPQQAYCDTYSGECGKAMRRLRRKRRAAAAK